MINSRLNNKVVLQVLGYIQRPLLQRLHNTLSDILFERHTTNIDFTGRQFASSGDSGVDVKLSVTHALDFDIRAKLPE